MKLRTRLALTLAVLVVPLALTVALYVARARERTVRETVSEALWQRVDDEARRRCEADPARWPRGPRIRGPRRRGRGRGAGPLAARPHVSSRRGAGPFPFDRNLESAHPDAPVLSPDVRAELREALASEPSHRVAPVGGRGPFLAVRMPWEEGPCAVLLVRPPHEPEGTFRRALVPTLFVSLGSILLAVFVAGPMVRRIRRLIGAIREGRPVPEALLRGADELTELSRAFEDRRRTLEERLARIEAQEEALRRFVANTAHDVMTPVTVLQGHLAAIEEASRAGEGVDPGRLREAMEEAHYVSSLLRNLNLAAKLEAGASFEKHPVDLNALVERIVARYRPYARQREVAVDFAVPEPSLRADGDVTLLEQALGNLVQNAIRYNDRGGHVAVLLEGDASAGGFRLVVLDDGPGVDEADLARITERGYRGARARMRRPGGLGLGLALVRDVAERHGFDLAFESPEEGGLRVVLRGKAASGGVLA